MMLVLLKVNYLLKLLIKKTILHGGRSTTKKKHSKKRKSKMRKLKNKRRKSHRRRSSKR
jgi:hypothetical protein